MNNPDTEPRNARFGFRTPAGGWKWAACLLPAVLAGAFAGAGQAQPLYERGLDEAVSELARTLVIEADLENEKVLVKSDDFFEMETELRLGLSEMLRGLIVSELTRSSVPVSMPGSDEDAVKVLHGRWRRESEKVLYLELFVAAPVESGDPTALKSAKGRVPIDESIKKAIESTRGDWGRLLVLRLERGVRDQKVRTVHLQPMTIGGDGGQGDELKGLLGSWLGSALVGSRLFRLVEPPPGVAVETDGRLYVEAALRPGNLEVSLRVVDNKTWQRVTFARVEMDRSLFPPGMFGPDVREAVRAVEETIGRGELGEARRRLEDLRRLDPGHSRLEELEEEVVRAERKREDDEAFARAKAEGTVAAFDGYLSSCGEVCGHGAEARRLRAEAEEREHFLAGKKFRDCPECPEMVVVPEGSFEMGSPESEEGRGDSEGPVHEVTMARPFAVGVYEVTFAEWDACVSDGGCGGYRPGDDGWGRGVRPVINVSWVDAQGYVRWLSRKTGEAYRLLSESEWEYVARAETTGPYHFGSSLSPSQANYGANRGGTVPVGSYSANGFGLHDVHGNVWEWVEDCWNNRYYGGVPADGSAWVSGDCGRRVLRGGSWGNDPGSLRSAGRIRSTTGFRFYRFGFRVARTLTP